MSTSAVVVELRRAPLVAAVLRDLLTAVGTAGNRVPDAHLAALAIEHGAPLYPADEDFGRFPGLVRIDPLRA